jgi:hypothetical protein
MMGQHDELIKDLKRLAGAQHDDLEIAGDAAAAIEQLQAQLAETREHLRIEEDECARQCARNETLQAQLAEAQKDAHHYKVCYEASTRAFGNLTDRAEAAVRSRDEIVEAFKSLLEACDKGRMVPRPGCGAGGQTIEANIKASVLNGVPAWPVEEARDALRSLIEAVAPAKQEGDPQ